MPEILAPQQYDQLSEEYVNRQFADIAAYEEATSFNSDALNAYMEAQLNYTDLASEPVNGDKLAMLQATNFNFVTLSADSPSVQDVMMQLRIQAAERNHRDTIDMLEKEDEGRSDAALARKAGVIINFGALATHTAAHSSRSK